MRSLSVAIFAVAAVVLGMLVPQADAAIPAHGRGWELVSVNPPSSSRVPGLWPISADGNQLVISTVGPPLGTESGAAFGFTTAVRGSSGWTNTPLGIPYDAEFAEGINGIASALAPIFAIGFGEATLWWANVPLTPGAPPEGDLALYRQFPGKGPEFISKTGTGVTFFNFSELFMDISSDGKWVVFTTEEHLLPGDAGRTQGQSVYAWNGSALELVDVDSGGNLLEPCGSRISKANGMAVSSHRVFFNTAGGCGNPEKVYLADLDTGDTTEISASLCTRLDCNAATGVSFVGATPDGHFAYMTTTQQLVDADENSARDLYRYNAETSQLTLLSGAPAVEGEVVPQQRVFPSEGGERVYFRAAGKMLPGESTLGEKIFMADGSGLHLVAEAQLVVPDEFQLSANGKRALFVTQTPLAAGDTDSQGDVYLYDADAGNLTWVSTGPSGANAELPARIEPSAPLSRWEFQYGNTQIYRAMDAAGDRVLFQTAESLVPEDTNTEADVYELWNGDLGLISPGNQPLRSDFAGVSRDGKTVAFGTNAALVGSDKDGESRDLYVARVGGGFPEPPPAGPGCDNARCPIPLGERLAPATPPSLTRFQSKSGALRLIEVASKAKKGAVAVVVSVPAPGLVSGQISTQRKGKKVVLAAGSKRAKQAGKVELKLKLTPLARRSAAGAVDAQLTLTQGSAKVSQTVKVSLP